MGLFLLPVSTTANAAEAAFPGTRSQWQGFDRYDFEIDGVAATVVAPEKVAPGRPWLWRGEFFGHRPEPDIALLGHGFHVVYLRVPDLFGSPKAMAHWDKFYQILTAQYGFSSRAALVGVSRGGLYCYNWASLHPDRVSCIYGDAPVCDLHSWPMGKRPGEGNAGEIAKLLKAYDVDSVEALEKVMLNPIDRLEPLAQAKIPLLHVYGDQDVPVPWDLNTKVIADRYQALGGEITLIPKPGVGHVHGLDDVTPLVNFILQSTARFNESSAREPVEIGGRRELMIDRFLIDELQDCELRLQTPRDEGPVLSMDQKWEGIHAGYTTLLKDGSQFRMYYRGISQPGPDGSPFERTCVSFSEDGIHWERPSLGLYEFEGSTANNIVLANAAPVTHNFCPFIDQRPDVPAAERYKAVGGTGKELFAYISADGLRWTRSLETPILSSKNVGLPHLHLFDSQNLAFWSAAEQTYVCYFRVWDGRWRKIARSTSPDFRTWSSGVLMSHVHDDGLSTQPAPQEHLYTNQTSSYFRAPHLYVATAARFFEGRRVLTDEQARAIRVDPRYFNDTSDVVFLTSRGGSQYDRTFLEGFLRPGIGPQNWVSRTNYPALNILQTGPSEMSLYVNQDYAQPTSHIQRYSLRLDGFASIHAGAATGQMVTRPLKFQGTQLSINFSSSAAGAIQVQVEQPDGTPIVGLSQSDCREQIGNEIERIVQWKDPAVLAQWQDKPVRLRFFVREADLFAFQFQSP